MSQAARAFSFAGGEQNTGDTPVAASLQLSPNKSVFFLTGTATVTALNDEQPILPGRMVTLIQKDAGTTTLTNTNGATAIGTMDLGGSNLALGQGDTCMLVQTETGSWLRVSSANN